MTELIQCSEAEYFAIPGRFHVSSTAKLLTSPALYAAEYEQTDSKDLGSYIHGLRCGDTSRFSHGPDLSQCKTDKGVPTTSKNATSVQKAIAEWELANPNAILLTAELLSKGPKCAAALEAAEVAEGLEVLHREVCILWDDPQGRPCILRADAIAVCAGVLVCLDYKSHGKPLTAKGLSNAAADYYYPSQGAHYLDGIAAAQKAGLLPDMPAEFRIAWVSTAAPFDAWIQDVDGEALAIGAADLEIAKSRWWAGQQSGIWPTAGALGLLPRKMTLPKWKQAKIEEEF